MDSTKCDQYQRNLLNILHNIEVAFIFPFSSSRRLKVRARCKYGAGCPSFQHAAHLFQFCTYFTIQIMNIKNKYKSKYSN